MDGAKIGPCCNVGQNVVISPDVVLGRNVKVQNNVSIYSGVTCEEGVFLGPSMVFTNIPNPRSDVVRRDQYRNTLVKRGTTIGANATIICGRTLGEYCFIGAGTVVTKDVAPYALVMGNPGKQTGWMSRHGEKLDLPASLPEGEKLQAQCPATGEKYELCGSTLKVVESTPHKKKSRSKVAVPV
jgi:UDP-2-acetamido-3-amino-2,3-dideoxy-glucuronate N-acetyltransferase